MKLLASQHVVFLLVCLSTNEKQRKEGRKEGRKEETGGLM
jgi:hypothetical protein